MTARRRDTGALPEGSPPERVRDEARVMLDALLPGPARVVAALSGGADSTALAWLAHDLRPDLDLHLGHVRHGLRDDDADLAWVRELAGRLGRPLHELDAKVTPTGQGLEAAARDARYDALAALARDVGTDAVLVAHSADDQAETALLRLARGTGLHGLAAMAPERRDPRGIRVLRPLLRVRRADLRALLQADGLRWVEDPTNTDAGQRRARARHEVLPALARLHGGPGDVVGALARLAAHARRDEHALQVLAEREYRRIGRRWGPVLALPRDHLAAMPEGLALRVVRQVLAELGVPRPSARLLLAALDLSAGQSARIGQVALSCGGGWLAAAPAGMAALAERPLAVPGHTALPELDLAVWTDLAREPVDDELLSSAPPGARRPMQARLPVPPDAELAVRARRPGDRVRLRVGTRSLQDVLTDTGVPRLARDLLPVVVDARGQVVWVPGVVLARDPSSLSHVRAWVSPHGAR